MSGQPGLLSELRAGSSPSPLPRAWRATYLWERVQQHARHLGEHVLAHGLDVGEAAVDVEGRVQLLHVVGLVVGFLDEGEEGAVPEAVSDGDQNGGCGRFRACART